MIQKLINFRAPLHVIRPFDELCRYNSSTRTSVLVTLMSDHIATQSQKIHEKQARLESLREHLSRTGSFRDEWDHTRRSKTPVDEWENEFSDMSEPDRFFILEV